MLKRLRQNQGFTIMELMIVVAVIGILAIIAIPNYVRISNKAKESVVRENIHGIQLAMEVFAINNAGAYPSPADQPALRTLMPGGVFPENPFTNLESIIVWNVDPGSPGHIGIFNLPGGGYKLQGFGVSGLLVPPVVVGN